MLCLSCNIKKSKTTVKLSENSRDKSRSKRFQRRNMWRQRVYCHRSDKITWLHRYQKRKHYLNLKIVVDTKKIFSSKTNSIVHYYYFTKNWSKHLSIYMTTKIHKRRTLPQQPNITRSIILVQHNMYYYTEYTAN